MNKLNIVIFGLGVVGSSLIKILEKNKFLVNNTKINIVGIKASSKNKKRIFNTKKYHWIDDLSSLDDKKVDLIIELVGGTDRFVNSIYQYAIKKKISLITANKAQLAEKGTKYYDEFDKNNIFLGFEAAVLGAVPVVRTISQVILPKSIKSIYGIFNGTTNYILSQMYTNKISFKDSLDLAVKNGFAEKNSSSDLSGKDAAHKLVLLSNLSFHQKFNFKSLSYSGIENIKLIDLNYGLQLGYKLKLLSISEKIGSNFYTSVAPCFIKENSIMANVELEDNLCIIEGNDFIKATLIGKGAGGLPTATSVISDLSYYINKNTYKVFNSDYSSMSLANSVNDELRKKSYYIRLSAVNKIGVLKTITQFFAKKSISIKSIIQLNPEDSNTVPIVIISNVVSHKKIIEITKLLKKNSYIKKEISTIRIEENIG
ncbi:homoserine dehydrogenase [Alphaproteobacteria bacterium]|nr:homoserine dehydrogenase [Alphaproteobacteria bacterium]